MDECWKDRIKEKKLDTVDVIRWDSTSLYVQNKQIHSDQHRLVAAGGSGEGMAVTAEGFFSGWKKMLQN